ncbi:MAG: shikimate kinase I [Gammaproteobacteria bacterium]|nr:MAG: shikimate kinase I [Gammaproteobacteria bacterium]
MSNNIVLVGPMGAGKTTLGKKLAKYLKRPFIDVDETIQQRLGVTIQTIFDTEGEAGFRQRELAILGDILRQYNDAVIATGGGCVLTPDCRKLIVSERLVVHVDVGLTQQCERLKYDKKRPILQGGSLREKLKKLRAERHDIYRSVADMHLMTDRMSFKKMLLLIEQQLTN